MIAIQTGTIRLWLMDYWEKPGSLETRLVRAFDTLVEGLEPRARAAERGRTGGKT